MKAKDLVAKAKDIATKYKTLYVMGCFGSPMNSTNKQRYTNNHSYNQQTSRKNKINNASADTFGFDCVCLLKGILWGWNGDVNKTYGGAVYCSNGVPDVNADTMMNSYCKDISTNFSNIKVGEFVWMSGHIGVYIGDGLAVECTPIWKDGVQITAVGNIGSKSGYNTRTWVKHGKSVFVDYTEEKPVEPVKPVVQKYAIGDKVVLNGQLYTTSTGDTKGKVVSNVVTNITRYNAGAKHPYNTTGDLGWMDEGSISKYVEPKEEKWTPKVGDIVVPITLYDYRGKHLIQYDDKYEILQIDNRGAVLGAVRGNQRPIWAVLKLDNIKKV